ncbi:ketosynthase chain-length factor, partial [Streptomyces sp. T21Q-yed]|nr:ketosynthase chain-length factor [Streptomyces sp. T21Q-yed]
DVDVVFADGAGVPELDAAEARAIGQVFGSHGVPVTVPKTTTGRLYSGGGPLDVVTALMSLREGVIPPTAGVRSVPQEYGIDLVLGEPRTAPLRTALVLARGRWGFNSAVVLRRPVPTP